METRHENATTRVPQKHGRCSRDRRDAREKLYSPSLSVVAGKVKIPDGPGWGVRINPAWLEKATYQQSERPAR